MTSLRLLRLMSSRRLMVLLEMPPTYPNNLIFGVFCLMLLWATYTMLSVFSGPFYFLFPLPETIAPSYPLTSYTSFLLIPQVLLQMSLLPGSLPWRAHTRSTHKPVLRSYSMYSFLRYYFKIIYQHTGFKNFVWKVATPVLLTLNFPRTLPSIQCLINRLAMNMLLISKFVSFTL